MYQKTIIVGNAGADATLRYLPDGTPVVNLSIAVNHRINDKDVTQWVKVVCWRGLTEAAKHVVKGQTVTVDGRVEIEQWVDNGGNARADLKLIAQSFRFVGGRPGGAAAATGEVEVDDIPF